MSKNRPKVVKWDDIYDPCRYSKLIVGNGLSIAVDRCFEYEKLSDCLPDNVDGNLLKKFFRKFNTYSFEYVMEILNTSIDSMECYISKDFNPEQDRSFKNVIKELKEYKKTVTQLFFEAIKQNHCKHSSVKKVLPEINKFLKCFDIVVSLNYDLIIYWSIMCQSEYIWDCFALQSKDKNTLCFDRSIASRENGTKVFYAHGNLILHKDTNGNTSKICKPNFEFPSGLLPIIRHRKLLPIIITEGTHDKKLRYIQRNSDYLGFIYDEIIPRPSDSLVIYGCSLENDHHILDKALEINYQKVAISLYRENYKPYHKLVELMNYHDHDADIICFDSESIFSKSTPEHQQEAADPLD